MDHLDSVQRRKELGAYKPELRMIDEVRHSMDDYGHFVSKAMEKVCITSMTVTSSESNVASQCYTSFKTAIL